MAGKSASQGPGASLGQLWRLLDHAGPAPRRDLWLAIALTALAAIGDIASLALLKGGMASLVGGVGADTGGSGAASRAMSAFLAAALVATVLRLLAQRRTVAAQYGFNLALADKAFRVLQMQEYAEYLKSGASAGFTAFERLNLICYQALTPFIAALSALLGVTLLLGAFAWIYPAAGLPVALLALLLAAESGWRARRSGRQNLSSLAEQRSVLLYEARAAFRDIYLTNGQERMCADFAEAEAGYRGAQASGVIAAQSARHTIEIAGIAVALALVLAYSAVPAGSRALVPALAVLALATLRVLPQVATLRSSLRMIVLHGDVTQDVRDLLDRAPPSPDRSTADGIVLGKAIRLEGVTVRREDRPDTLRALDLVVPRGTRIGVMGESGSGKSTLLDVICGAIEPDAGRVMIDGTPIGTGNGAAWRERIGVVSQAPVLLGRTLREAVVFPERVAEADPERFAAAVERAGIPAMLEGFARGLDTPVGEAVSFLSGGQRQRLALAHALYRARDLLILDEATGQLDASSEDAILAAIAALPHDLTVIVVSHRPALFAGCDALYALADGRLAPVTSVSAT